MTWSKESGFVIPRGTLGPGQMDGGGGGRPENHHHKTAKLWSEGMDTE